MCVIAQPSGLELNEKKSAKRLPHHVYMYVNACEDSCMDWIMIPSCLKVPVGN